MTHFKGKAARNFIAELMIEEKGEAALDGCDKDGPIYKAIQAELDRKKDADAMLKAREES